MSFLKSCARAFAQVVVAVLFIALPMMLLKLAIMPMLGLDRNVAPIEAIDSLPVAFFSNIVLTLLSITLSYWAYIKIVERRPASELTPRLGIASIGLISGVVLIGVPLAILFATGNYKLISYSGFSSATFAICLIVFSVVLLEEIFFRGVLFGVLERHFGTIAALLVQSTIFALMHMTNDNWAGPLPLLSVFLAGCAWTCLYLIFRNIWVVVLHHTAWNLTVFAIGLPLTGVGEWREAAPIQSDFHGSILLTGGASGPEASILTIIVLVLAFAFMAKWAWTKNLFLKTQPSPTPDTAEGT